MPSIELRLKDVLDETRLAMLGTQLLVGIQYRVAFTPAFGRLPVVLRWLDGAALLFILCSTGFLLATPSFHQIAEAGHATGRMLRLGSGYLRTALAPLAVALGIDVGLAFYAVAGSIGAVLAGASFVLASATAWFAIPFWAARTRWKEEPMADKKQSLEVRIEQALTEIRVVLPGAQALFGFQVAAVLTEEFARLPAASRYAHLGSVAAVAIAVVMLIAPAAYHRIAARGNAEEGVLNYAVRMMIPAEGLIALGLVGDAYVTVRLITESQVVAISTTLAALVGFATLLYAIPWACRARRQADPLTR